MNQRAKLVELTTFAPPPYRVDAYLHTGVLSIMGDIYAGLANRWRRAVIPLISHISSVCEYLIIGIGLGFLGTALVACAIPLLACIPH